MCYSISARERKYSFFCALKNRKATHHLEVEICVQELH